MLTITVGLPLAPEEVEILSTLLGTGSGALAVQATAPAPAAKAPAKSTPKAAPAVEATPEAEDDLLGTADSGVSLEEAVKAATEMVSEGKTAEVRKALGVVGAKRVSDVKDKDAQAFYDALGL